MLFQARYFESLRDGSVTRTFRLWKSAKVKVGGRYRFGPKFYTGVDALEVTRVKTVKMAGLTRSSLKGSGFDSKKDLVREVERAVRRKLTSDDVLTCVDFRYVQVEPKPEAPRRVKKADVELMVEKIEAMEGRSKDGPWVWRALSLIEEHPKRRAGDLAEMAGAEMKPFKSRIRRLKGLGLTQSFEIGYGLTALGKACLKASGH